MHSTLYCTTLYSTSTEMTGFQIWNIYRLFSTSQTFLHRLLQSRCGSSCTLSSILSESIVTYLVLSELTTIASSHLLSNISMSAESTSATTMRDWSTHGRLSSYDTLLFDCDGVLWHESHPIDGAIATLASLSEQGKRLLFATNNSGKSREVYAQKFTQLGFTNTVLPSQIITSSHAAAEYIASLPKSTFDKETQKVFVIGEAGIGEELKKKGIECVEAMKLFGGRHLTKAELAQTPIDPTIGCVLVGIDEQFTYTKCAYAVAHLSQLKKKDASASSSSDSTSPDYSCLFISTNQDSTLPTQGHTLPGAGSCVSMIATASGRRPINIGKPERMMMDLAVKENSLDPKRILMIGDRLDTDILFGTRAGVDTLFVTKTGVNRLEDCEKENIRPTFVADDVTCLMKGDGKK